MLPMPISFMMVPTITARVDKKEEETSSLMSSTTTFRRHLGSPNVREVRVRVLKAIALSESTQSSFVSYAASSSSTTNSVSDETFLDSDSPAEEWSHADYACALDETGVKLVLVTLQEMDVLLARAANHGWDAALGMK
ncbi:hypothetical protein IAR50_007426 [Cryptococcus sp. DSM 104548]